MLEKNCNLGLNCVIIQHQCHHNSSNNSVESSLKSINFYALSLLLEMFVHIIPDI